MLYLESYAAFFKWHTDFTRWQDSATQRLRQQLTQTLPPLKECIPALNTRLILIHYTEPSPLLTPPTHQKIPAPQQD